jgi:hypothetical protein
MHTLRTRAGLAAAAVALAAPAATQTLPGTTVATGASFEAYYFENEDATGLKGIVLATMPFAARVALPARFSMELSGAYARGEVIERDDGRSTLEGFTDTQLRLSRVFGRDRLTVSLIAAIPTGHATHDEEEARVADAVSADLLPFRVSNWGTGGGLGLSAAYAIRAGGFGLGLAAGHLFAGEFEPFADTEAELRYRPGDETTVRVALDRTVSRSGKVSLQTTWQHYAEDQLSDDNLYRAGDRLQLLAAYQTGLGRSTGVVYAGMLHRENGTSLDATAPGSPVQDLWLGGGGLRMALGRVMFTPSVEGRVFRSEDGTGQGWYTGAGAGFEVPVGRLVLVPTVRGRFGNVVAAEDAETGLSGGEASLMLRLPLR